jgi:hypothetical protein
MIRSRFRRVASFLRRHWPWVFAAGFAVSVYRAWLTPGFLFGDDQFRFADALTRTYFPWRSAWDGSILFGTSAAYASPSFPVWSFVGLLARLGAGFDVGERVVWFWPLLALLVTSPYALAYRLSRSAWAATVAASLYAVNTWTVALVQRGHIPSLVAYAVMPFAVMAFAAWLRRPTARASLLFAGLLTFQNMYDLRYAYIACIVCLILMAFAIARTIARHKQPAWAAMGRGAAWVALGLVAFNAYWLIPQIAAPAALPPGYDTLTYFVMASRFESIWHSLTLFTPFYHYVQGTDPFALYAVEAAFFIIPAIVVAALIGARRNRSAAPIAVAAMIGVVLTSGPSSVFGAIVSWAFAHVPGMSLFRDISKFTSLVALTYSAALAIGFSRFAAVVRAVWGRAGRRMTAAAAILVCVGYAFIMRDAYNPERLSNFATTRLAPADVATQRFLDSQQGYFRTLVFPTWRPELVGTEAHPLVAADYLLENAQEDGGIRELFPEFASLTEKLASPVIPDLLGEAGVRYVVVIGDRTGGIYKPFEYNVQYHESVDFFASRPWLKEVARFGRYRVFMMVRGGERRAFFAAMPGLYSGDLRSIDAFVESPWWPDRPAIVTTTTTNMPASSAGPEWPRFESAGSRSPAPGWVLSRSVLEAPTATPLPDRLGGVVRTAGTGVAEAWLAGEPAGDSIDTVARDLFVGSGELRPESLPDDTPLGPRTVAVEIDDPNIISAPFPDDAAGARWYGAVKPSVTVDLTNPWSETMRGDVALNVASPDSSLRTLRITLGGKTTTVTVPGAGFPARPPATQAIQISGVRILPGVNSLRLDVVHGDGRGQASPGYALLLRDDISVETSPSGANSAAAASLHYAVRTTRSGVEVTMRLAAGDSRPSPAFRLLEAAPIVLSRHPHIDVGYRTSRSPIAQVLVVEIRRRGGGRRFEIRHSLPQAESIDSFDVFAAAQSVMDLNPELERTCVCDREASAFELSGVWLEAVAPTALRGSTATMTLSSARIDTQPSPLGLPAPRAAQSLSLASAVVQEVGGGKKTRRLTSRVSSEVATMRLPELGSSTSFKLPIHDTIGATRLTAWLSVPDGVRMDITLQFSRAYGERISTIAAGRPEQTDPDQPIPADWITDVGDAFGYDRTWRRYDIDLAEVEAYRLPDAGRGFTLDNATFEFDRVGALTEPGLASDMLVADPTLTGPETRKNSNMVDRGDAFTVDGRSPLIVDWFKDPRTGAVAAHTGAFDLDPGAHRVLFSPPLGNEVEGLVLGAPPKARQAIGSATGLKEISPSEYECKVNGAGGLLVLPVAFAPGWHAAIEPAAGPLMTGNAIVDLLRLRGGLVADSAHVMVNDAFNGWVVPSGKATIEFVYEPEAASEASAIFWLIGSIVLIAIVVIRRP